MSKHNRHDVIGFTASAFDMLHAGHCLMLREAKKVCDYLIVGLQTDPTIDREYKEKPKQSIMERYIQLASNKYVDEIVVYDTEDDLLTLLNSLPIDVRIIGEEYYGREFTGKHLPIKVHYNKRKHKMSSTNMRDLFG